MAADAWERDARAGRPEGPVAVEQFERHGFVHCCFREQLTEIATWWFDAGEALVALEIDAGRVGSTLRLERSPSRWYPHVYGPIPADTVVEAHRVPRSADGTAELPPVLRQPPPRFQLRGRLEPAGPEVVVRWAPNRLEGDERWVASARAAVQAGRLVPVVGGVVVPATLARAYDSFALLDELAAELLGYEGDGFFG